MKLYKLWRMDSDNWLVRPIIRGDAKPNWFTKARRGDLGFITNDEVYCRNLHIASEFDSHNKFHAPTEEA